jgi:hypothetical protein
MLSFAGLEYYCNIFYLEYAMRFYVCSVRPDLNEMITNLRVVHVEIKIYYLRLLEFDHFRDDDYRYWDEVVVKGNEREYI